MTLTIGSLFSGIGGLELGLEWSLGARTVWQVEREEFPRKVLAKHWPDVDRSVQDVREANVGTLCPVDVICGGFPCQDLSPAGSRKGLAGERSGLAFEFLRIVGDLGPRGVVVENTGHGWRGWVPELRRRFHALGYASMPLRVRAADVGAPHIRARVFLVAWQRASDANRTDLRNTKGADGRREAVPRHPRPARSSADAALGDSWGAPPSAIRRMDDGPRPRMDRPRLRALGNAVVPQCAAVVGIYLDGLGVLR